VATRVKIIGLEKVSKRIKTQVGRAIKQSGFERDLLGDVIEEIRENGIEPELRPATIKRRERLATVNPTDSAYSSGKSNLTFTGQLLNSLRVKFQVSKLVFNFTSIGKHRPYKLIRKKKTSASARVSNSEIFRGQEELYQRSIANIFTRGDFKTRLVNKLKQSIKKFLTN
jgi:hypothetical protein